MRVYLACDANNAFFIEAVKEAVDGLSPSPVLESVELIFAPLRWGGDTGKVLNNVLRVMDSDLVLFDVTPMRWGQPEASGSENYRYNPGVMIEYGIVLAMENPRSGLPWYGNLPKPSYRLFCSTEFPRGQLTPIINAESVAEYGRGEGERAKLSAMIKDEIEKKIRERLTFNYRGQTVPQR